MALAVKVCLSDIVLLVVPCRLSRYPSFALARSKAWLPFHMKAVPCAHVLELLNLALLIRDHHGVGTRVRCLPVEPTFPAALSRKFWMSFIVKKDPCASLPADDVAAPFMKSIAPRTSLSHSGAQW